MRERANDGILVGQLGQSGKMLRDLKAGHRRGNRFELASNFLGGIRFQIPCIELAWAPPHEKKDTPFGSPESRQGGEGIVRLGAGRSRSRAGPMTSLPGIRLPGPIAG